MVKHSPLLKHLEKIKKITESQAKAIIDQQKILGTYSDAEVILALGFMEEQELVRNMAEISGLKFLTFSEVEERLLSKEFLFVPEAFHLVPSNTARTLNIFPLSVKHNILTLAVFDPFDSKVEMELEEKIGIEIKRYVLTRRHINKLIDRYYHKGLVLSDILKRMLTGDETAIPEMVNAILEDAYRKRTTDIHFCPEKHGIWLRYRIDGVLQEQGFMLKSILEPLCSRLKIMAKLDIAETRAPQDGHLTIELTEKNVDVRISFLNTIHGENIVLRLLDSATGGLSLQDLGFNPEDANRFGKMIKEPQGMILITGPTGSGKTTSLFSAIRILNKLERNIMTLEDPVEIRLPIIRQSQINPKANVTFATGLRSILRQDPDIILIGEIRDHETMELAVRASLTGHLVFSTLHTNNAPETAYRLVDLGLSPTLMTSVIISIIAQRLVRRICSNCNFQVSEKTNTYKEYQRLCELANLKELSSKPILSPNEEGCVECNKGYRERIGLFEILNMTSEIKKTIMNITNISPDEFRSLALEQGMTSLWQDGLQKTALQITGIAEVERVLGSFK